MILAGVTPEVKIFNTQTWKCESELHLGGIVTAFEILGLGIAIGIGTGGKFSLPSSV